MYSSDAKWAVCRTQGVSDVYAVSLEDSTAPRPILVGPARTEAPRVSPNGKWRAFQSDEVRGQYDVFVTSFPVPGAHIKISINGGQEPLWDRSGRTLYYRTLGKVFAEEMDPATGARTSEPRTVLTGNCLIHPRNAHQNYDVAADGRFLIVKPVEGGVTTVVAHNWVSEFRGMLAGRKREP